MNTLKRFSYMFLTLPFIIIRILFILVIFPLLLLPLVIPFFILENNEKRSFWLIWKDFIDGLVPENKLLMNGKYSEIRKIK